MRGEAVAVVRPAVGLALYGVVLALLSMSLLGFRAEWPTSYLREYFIDDATTLQENGWPPLVAHVPFRPGEPQYMAAGAGDDAGAYIIAPALARVLGLERGVVGLRLVYLLMFGAGIALYPLCFYRLFGSAAAALLAPLGLLAAMLTVVGNADVYWAAAWAPLVLGPPLLLVAVRRPRAPAVWLGAIALAASLATSLRSGAGLGIAIGCVAAALVVQPDWKRRIATALVVVVAYLAVTPAGVAAVEAYRNAHLRVELVEEAPTAHLFWHPLYLGLGFLPNRYGLRWKDSIAIEKARAIEPDAVYPTGRYDAVVRRLFMRVVRDDPAFVVSMEARKTVLALGLAPALSLLAVLALYLLALLDPRWLRPMLLLVPTALLGLGAGVLGVPDAEYILGWLGTLALVAIMGAAVLVRERAGALRRLRSRRVPARASAAVALAALAATAAAFAAPSLTSRCEEWQGSKWITRCGGYEYPLPL